MRNCWSKVVSVLVFATWCCHAAVLSNSQDELRDLVQRHTKRTAGGVHLPIVRTTTQLGNQKRATGGTGVGDFIDVTYNVLLKIGDVVTPLVLDTGSSDLWVASTACTNCKTSEPLYPESTFQSTGLDARLLYGDSLTGTHAFGKIGMDTVTITDSGLKAEKQYFAAIDDTNTTVLLTGSTGIFGLGFPINSFIWNKMFRSDNLLNGATRRSRPEEPVRRHGSESTGGNLKRLPFPSIADLYPTSISTKRQAGIDPAVWTEHILDTFGAYGPFLSRLMQDLGTSSELSVPLVAITLQRDTVEIGSGNLGTLSIGELPAGANPDSMTWVPIRGYAPKKGGLLSPANSPNAKNGGEVYPIAWELFIDDVYLDGVKLPKSTLSDPSIHTSALIDTGNSLIRGPPDIIQNIVETISPAANGLFPCEEAHVLSFSIGGKMFNVDPRDFLGQVFDGDTKNCRAMIAPTDVPNPSGGYQYSWSLGDPFLKGVVAAFHYGNITYPSQNPPTIGLLSTVASDPATLKSQLNQALQKVKGNDLPSTTEVASDAFPTGSVIGGASLGNPVSNSNGNAPAPNAPGGEPTGKLGNQPSSAGRPNITWAMMVMGMLFVLGGTSL